MLQDLRDKAQGFIAWIIVGMIALTFILFGTGSMFSGQSEQVVAKVDGKKISLQEIDVAYQRLLSQSNGQSLKQLDPTEVKKKLLDSLIDEAILLQEQKRLGMSVNAEQVNATLYSIPFLQESGQFSPNTYARFLENARFTDREFRSLIQDNLLKRQLEQGLIQTAFSLDNEVELAAKFVFQERDFRAAEVKRDAFKDAVSLSEDNLKAYYDAHLTSFMSDEQIDLEYVVLSLPELENQISPTDKELQDFYEAHKDQFSVPARVLVKHILIAVPAESSQDKDEEAKVKADKIYQEIKKGESFDKLAKKYSGDNKSAANGGELAWISQSEMASDFEKVAFTLDKPGQVSDPLRMESGYEIIKLVEKQAEKSRPFATVKADVLKKYKSQVAQDKFYHMVDEISVIAYEQPDSLQPIVDKYQLPLKKTGYFSQKNPPEISELLNTAVLTAAFSQPVKEDKNNSELIQLNDENYIVLRVNELKPSIQKPFAEVKAEVKEQLLNEKLDELVKAAAEKLLAEVQNGKGDKLSVNWQDYSKVTRSNKELNPIILDAAFSLPKPQKSSDEIATLTRLQTGDYAVIWLTQVIDGDGSKLSIKEKQSYQSSLANILGELEFALYSTELVREAKVKKYIERI